MNRPCGSTRTFFPSRGNQKTGFEVVAVTIILNVTRCRHEGHAKESARGKQCAVYFFLVACLPYSWTLKLEAMLSFKMSVNFHPTSRHHIAEDTTTLLTQKICVQTYV
jgi:hypothetical protein